MMKLTLEIDDMATAVRLLSQLAEPVKIETPTKLEIVPTAPEPVAPYTAPDMPLPVAAPTAAPAFTVEQVAKAGANLLTSKPDLMGPLQELLSRYGVGSVKELPTDKLGEFAAELRKMGAKI